MSELVGSVDSSPPQPLAAPSPQTDARSRKAALNALAAGLEYFARLAVGFLLKPLLVSTLGTFGFGAWELLSKLAGYLDPLTGRAGQALKWQIANQQATGDVAVRRSHVGSALLVWCLLFPLVLLLSAGLAWSAPSFLQAPSAMRGEIRLATFLLGLNVALASLAAIPRAVLEGENLGYKRMGVSTFLTVAGGGLTALAVWWGLGLVGVAAAALIASLMTGAFFVMVVRRHVSWFGWVWPSRTATRAFGRLTGWFLGWQVVWKVMRSSDVVVLGLFASVELVTVYSLTKYAPEVAIQLVSIVVFGILPGLGGILGTGDVERAARVRADTMALTWLVTVVAGGTTLLWNRSFLDLWVGPELQAGPVTTLLIVVMVTQLVLIFADANVIDVTLNLWAKVVVGLLSVAIAFASAALLVGLGELGIVGVCLGMIAGRSILSVAYPWIAGHILKVSFLEQLRASCRPFIVTGVAFALAFYVAPWVRAENWPMLVGGVAVSLAVFPLPIWYAGLSRGQQARLRSRLHSVAQRKFSGGTGS